jgi:hypothetical protein
VTDDFLVGGARQLRPCHGMGGMTKERLLPSGGAPNARQRTCVIVAGMYRSGTSATARVVNLLGADITKELVPASIGNNDRGFWEPIRIVKIHDRLLDALGSSCDDPLPLPERWLKSAATFLRFGRAEGRGCRPICSSASTNMNASDFLILSRLQKSGFRGKAIQQILTGAWPPPDLCASLLG